MIYERNYIYDLIGTTITVLLIRFKNINYKHVVITYNKNEYFHSNCGVKFTFRTATALNLSLLLQIYGFSVLIHVYF